MKVQIATREGGRLETYNLKIGARSLRRLLLRTPRPEKTRSKQQRRTAAVALSLPVMPDGTMCMFKVHSLMYQERGHSSFFRWDAVNGMVQ